jgi:hypothetical protein
MNSLWKTILDGLTYKDLAGKRQPRAYTALSGLILLLLLCALGMAGLNHYLLMSKVLDAPAPISFTAPVTEVKPPAPTRVTEAAVNCPIDSADWSLTATYVSENYKTIQPACVYQGLEKTIAWALAVRAGYSRAEATRQLGFAEMPMRQLDRVTIPSATNKPLEVPVSFIPPNPNFTEWRLDQHGKAAVTYALRGCFRTSIVVGNRVEIWGGDYPVICVVTEDAENTWIVYALDGHIYTSPAKPMRSFLLFGYVSDGTWVWLGTRDDPKLEITDAQANARERLTIATLYDSQPWDSKWLMNTYHLVMQPLPENWQTMTDEKEKQAIIDGLSSSSNGGTQ